MKMGRLARWALTPNSVHEFKGAAVAQLRLPGPLLNPRGRVRQGLLVTHQKDRQSAERRPGRRQRFFDRFCTILGEGFTVLHLGAIGWQAHGA